MKYLKASEVLQCPGTIVHPVCLNVGPFNLMRCIYSGMGITWDISKERQYGCRLNYCAVN